jgi:hypothetical protein
MVIAAAGALSVATAASATAATWGQGAQSHTEPEAKTAAADRPGDARLVRRMASAGPDWQTNAATQIKWGLDYIKGTYGSPCGAWSHEEATGWY